MQRLNFNPDEKMSRKEYLKRKKKQSKKFKKISKLTYIVISIICLLSIYLGGQFYVYSKTNNYKYVAGDDVNQQKIYDIYYITEGYTYNPKYSLNFINSDGFNEKVVFEDVGIKNITSNDKYIYGIKEGVLYRIEKASNVFETLVDKDVIKYTMYKDEIYYVVSDNNKLLKMDANTKEVKEFNISNVSELLIDDNYIYAAIDSKTKKQIIRYDKNGENSVEITKDSNPSYMIQDNDNIYFVNKADSSKLYSVSKATLEEKKLADVTCVADKGNIKEIDGSKYMFLNNKELFYINISDSNTLWKLNLENGSNEKVLSMEIEILQNIDTTVFFKVKNEVGVYLYNYETKFISQVTKNKTSDFYVDGLTKNIDKRKNTQVKN